MPRNPNCTRCPLHVGATTVCVYGTGPTTAQIMLLGEAPGENEDITGKPFVGAAGEQLDKALYNAGLTRSDVYITNIVKCRPEGNRNPLPDEVSACFPYLAEEIAVVKPKIILALGLQAARALSGSKLPMKQLRGHALQPARGVRLNGTQLMATYHPAAFLHSGNPQIIADLTADLSMVKAMAMPSTLPLHEMHILYPEWQADDLQSLLYTEGFEDIEPKVVAVDCEWTAVQDRSIGWPWTPNTELYSISLSTQTATGAIHSIGLAWPPYDDVAQQTLSDYLLRSKCIFHNAMADMPWLDSVGVRYALAGDTMLLAYLLDEEQPTSLETLAAVYAHIPPWKQPLWPNRPRDEQTWDELLSYNQRDTMATLLVLKALYQELRSRPEPERSNILRLYQNLMLPALAPYVEMARQGVPLHERRLHGAIAVEEQKQVDAVARLSNMVGGNLRPDKVKLLATSTDQTAEHLRKAYKLELPGSAKDDLTPYTAQYPIVKVIQEVRSTQKNLSTYLEPWAALLAEQGDGRLHSMYRLGKVRTGRTSAEINAPNRPDGRPRKGGSLQVAPRDKWVKKLIAAPDGYDVVASDLSQIELRVIAWQAPEQHMIKLFNTGHDIHKASAADFLGIAIEEVTPDQRQVAKSANFGLAFGMQAEHYQAYAQTNYGITLTLEQARQTRARFFATYSDLVKWHKRCEQEDFKRGYSVTPFGRYRRHFTAVTEAINANIQSTADDLMKLALTAIYEDFLRYNMQARIVGTIHDSNIIISPHDETPAVIEIARTRMERPPTERLGVPFESIPVPLLADIAVGRSWGEAKPVKRPD